MACRSPRLIHAAFTLILLSAAAGMVHADTIQLKNGRRMTGKVVKQTTEQVVLDVGAGTVTLAVSEIASIEFGGPEPSGGTPALPEKHPATTRDVPRLEPTSEQPIEETLLDQFPQDPQKLLQLADDLLPVVAKLRGLQPTAPIEKRVVDKATIRQVVHDQLARQSTPEELTNKGKALIKLGLLPAAVDFRESIVELYTQQAAGMYDPHAKVLYLADWIPVEIQAATVAHELVHALQDQHFNLVRFLDEVKGDSEAQTARQALVEGEALAIMLDYQLQDQGLSFTDFGDLTSWIGVLLNTIKASQPHGSSTPTFLEELVLFPYLSGTTFLQAVRRRHPWSKVATLYEDPPRSTEQIMHPNKYLIAPDEPTTVTLPDLRYVLDPFWSKIDEDTLGELTIQLLVRHYLDERTAIGAAEGWDGDRYQLHEEIGTKYLLLVWLSVWDSPSEAKEFLEAYRQVIAKKYATAQPVAGKPDQWQTDSGDVYLEQRGAAVLVIEGAPRTRMEALIKPVWQESRRTLIIPPPRETLTMGSLENRPAMPIPDEEKKKPHTVKVGTNPICCLLTRQGNVSRATETACCPT